MLDASQQDLIAKFPLGFVATVTPNGTPAVSPKGTFLVLDTSTIAFGHIRSPGTLRNLEQNPAVEVNFADPFLRKALRVRGVATIHDQDTPRFAELHPRWRETWGDLACRVKAIAQIHIAEAQTITTPPYDDGVTEDEMLALYKAKYAEIYP